jgi:hypothetical protein
MSIRAGLGAALLSRFESVHTSGERIARVLPMRPQVLATSGRIDDAAAALGGMEAGLDELIVPAERPHFVAVRETATTAKRLHRKQGAVVGTDRLRRRQRLSRIRRFVPQATPRVRGARTPLDIAHQSPRHLPGGQPINPGHGCDAVPDGTFTTNRGRFANTNGLASHCEASEPHPWYGL